MVVGKVNKVAAASRQINKKKNDRKRKKRERIYYD